LTGSRSSSLISAAELHARLADERLRIADVRWYLNRPGAGRAAYDAGHIPGAIFVDLDTDLSDEHGYGAPGRHPLPSPQDVARRLGALGIGSDDLVVVYDDLGGAIAARLWWMLDNLGHRGGVAVLDGGIGAWQRAGLELSTDKPEPEPATLELAGEWHNVIEREELAARLADLTVLDGRAPERYRGEVEPIDPKAGHIPTALNAPVTNNVDARGAMRPPAELRDVYLDLATEGRPTVVSCGSGTTACHNALAMRVAGLPDPILYVGSFSDWSRSGMPVATGAERGEAVDLRR
jgi:thiosulfate/3-mercaptopyruvate sulfurtransferase